MFLPALLTHTGASTDHHTLNINHLLHQRLHYRNCALTCPTNSTRFKQRPPRTHHQPNFIKHFGIVVVLFSVRLTRTDTRTDRTPLINKPLIIKTLVFLPNLLTRNGP